MLKHRESPMKLDEKKGLGGSGSLTLKPLMRY